MIKREMQILEMNQKIVVFRCDIDGAWPETIIMTVTRERWEKEFMEETRCKVSINFDFEMDRKA